MKFFSFVQDGFLLTPVEVQVSLLPGLPDIKFSGLADMAIKESATRLKSAFKKCGFHWPLRQQIIVNLSPACIRKNSLGLDLALALALLSKTGQMELSQFHAEDLYAYGEVGLNGEIFTPENINLLSGKWAPLVTGKIPGKNFREGVYTAQTLQEIPLAKKAPVEDWKSSLEKPPLPSLCFSKEAAFILKLCAAGEHHLLLCGEAGSGKTTLAEHIYHLLPPPEKKFWEESRQMHLTRPLSWRPSVNPHHTTPPLSMIGGGCPIFPGEISRAHGGQLVMDEYLEFHPKVQEALREPLEKGKIRLVRRGLNMEFPAHFLLTATTNLCPCGDYVPGQPVKCSYSLKRCQSHLDRLSGPMLDRFDLLAFSNGWKGKRKVSMKSLWENVQEAQDFRRNTRKQKISNGRLEWGELESMISPEARRVLPNTTSHRRKRALLRVARTFADLKGDREIKGTHIEEVYALSMKNFYFLKTRMMAG